MLRIELYGHCDRARGSREHTWHAKLVSCVHSSRCRSVLGSTPCLHSPAKSSNGLALQDKRLKETAAGSPHHSRVRSHSIKARIRIHSKRVDAHNRINGIDAHGKRISARGESGYATAVLTSV